MPSRPPNWVIGLGAVAGAALTVVLALAVLALMVVLALMAVLALPVLALPVLALTAVLAPTALGIVGFSVAGPVAGTLAALIQSVIGNVVAGSLFALAQSVAMGGSLGTGVAFFGGMVGSILGWCLRAYLCPGEPKDGHFYAHVLNPLCVLSHITWSPYVTAMLHKDAASRIAATIQSGIGNVAAGSLFAMWQSIAMGAIPWGVYAVSGIIGGVTGWILSRFGGKGGKPRKAQTDLHCCIKIHYA
ncbi:hypothetical protein ARMSODRAFT_1012798 [Armillaria solidipes]|uniref:Uncharacterized protein n=1 Tax=Armillaria solidipes TaxID=1076256 RepID=A0A2H3CAJ4_9AGAR|nr:hypothetical protein ARMSODRAFT_1012798 [Armillaria solidipes]